MVEITGNSQILPSSFETTIQRLDPNPTFILPGQDETRAQDRILAPVVVPVESPIENLKFYFKAIAGYDTNYFSINMPSPDVRIVTSDNGSTSVYVAQITKITDTTSGTSLELTDPDQWLDILRQNVIVSSKQLTHSHTISS